MRCSSTDNGLPAGCRCSGTTVFDGATIGQVFTGSVEMTCPVARSGANVAQEILGSRTVEFHLVKKALPISVCALLISAIAWPSDVGDCLWRAGVICLWACSAFGGPRACRPSSSPFSNARDRTCRNSPREDVGIIRLHCCCETNRVSTSHEAGGVK